MRPENTSAPAFANAGGIFARAARALEVPELVDVPTAAERKRRLDNKGGGYRGPWTHEMTPYLVRPMACLTENWCRIVAIMGPSQCGKTEVANNWLLQSVLYDPADLLWCQADKDVMRDYVVQRVNPMLDLCPELRDRQLPVSGADNIFSKLFVGCSVRFIWPVASQFAMRPVPRGVLDDYDQMPEDIDGQGDAVSLMGGRQASFEGREKTLAISSPARGQKHGIEGIVATGTDETYRPPCPDCGEHFALNFVDHLFVGFGQRYYRLAEPEGRPAMTPAEAEQDAVVICPICGCHIGQDRKMEMLSRGIWAGPQQRVTAQGAVEGPAKDTDIASFRIDGMLGFRSWGRLAREFREAEIRFETAQDESKLRAYYNTRVGRNYASRVAEQARIEPHALAERLEAGLRLGVVPRGVRFLTAAVDVQGNRFEVTVKGWCEAGESWLVDRFAILEAPTGGKLDPARYAEHWGVLLNRVFWRQYPLAWDETQAAPILSVAIDTGGLDGVSEKAVQFYHTAVRAGVPASAVTLVKGGNNPNARLLPPPTYAETDALGRPKKQGARLWVPNVNEVKNIVFTRLHRTRPGPGYLHLPGDLDRAYLDELTAEEKNDRGRWEKVKPRNETWDLEVYNEVVRLRFAGERPDLGWVPAWALIPEAPPDTAMPAAADEPGTPGPVPPHDHPHARRPSRPRRMRRKSSFVHG